MLYIDRVTREPREVHARVVVLVRAGARVGAHPVQLGDRQDPNGLANSSGVLGHYLMDHLWVAGGARGVPGPAAEADAAMDAQRPNGIYVIRFRNTKTGPHFKEFLRGYGFQGGGAAAFNCGAPGFGEAFKQASLEPVTSLGLAGFGEACRARELRRARPEASTTSSASRCCAST